ncbi:TFIIH/NER complex subunit [Lambiella insularis]|nr:TFIIH/NER complex subunit [Lambiella insularis]
MTRIPQTDNQHAAAGLFQPHDVASIIRASSNNTESSRFGPSYRFSQLPRISLTTASWEASEREADLRARRRRSASPSPDPGHGQPSPDLSITSFEALDAAGQAGICPFPSPSSVRSSSPTPSEIVEWVNVPLFEAAYIMASAQTSRAGDADGELYTHFAALQPFLNSLANRDVHTEICPVCKSSRYLNPRMKFLINPECYHRMCESCVDRIFSQGPAPCPIAGCGRTLRKARFRKQTFDDLKIERECDIRARVESILNRREEEFIDLRSYNDYLEFKEDITFNLIEQKDVAATEAKLEAYRSANQISIHENTSIANREHSSLEELEAAKREMSRLSHEAARKEEEDKQLAKEASRREFTQLVADAKADPADILRGGPKVVLKKSTARRTAGEKAKQQQIEDLKHAQSKDPAISTTGGGNADPSLTIKGLKAPVAAKEEEPYDPFGGFNFKPKYYTLKSDYEHPWLDQARMDPAISAGGYDVGEYCARAMLESNAGLGVFIAEEKATREERAAAEEIEAEVGTAGAAVAAKEDSDVEMGDDKA